MKVAMVTGSYPPDVCGVGDYTRALVDALKELGVSVDVISGEEWRLGNCLDIRRRIEAAEPDIVHLQYPTIGYEYGLAPQMLCLLKSMVVTIHEASQARVLRKVSLLPFLARARHLVFTTEFERNYSLRLFPMAGGKSSVIPIGSNIPVGTNNQERASGTVVCFGLIQPNKGLEEFLEAARLASTRDPDLTFMIVGRVSPSKLAYYQDLRERSLPLKVEWCLDLSQIEVARVLSRVSVGYLPFPDGVSERRGSLLALLANGVVPITTRGAFTTPALAEVMKFANSPEQALERIQDEFRDPQRRAAFAEKGRAYARRFFWDAIARQHLSLYERFL